MNSVHLLPDQLRDRLEPGDLGQELTSAQRIEPRAEATSVATGEEEMVAIVIRGSVSFACSTTRGTAVTRDMVYVPRRSTLGLTSTDGGVVMCYWVPCDRDTSFAHIAFADVDADPARHHVYGDQATGSRRDVWDAIDAGFDSQRMLVGLCSGRPGGWTAWPPHEHAEQREETYVYFGMGDAFGVQLVYDDGPGMDRPANVALVQEGHLVSVPGGYHPSVGCPAGPISYAYFMASRRKEAREFMDLIIQPRFGTTFD